MKRRVIFLISLYVGVVILLSLSGFIGDRSAESMENALNYFTIADIEDGRSFYLHGMIPWTLYRIIAILVLALIFFKGYHERFAGLLDKKIKYYFLRIFISLAVLIILLTLIRFPLSLYAGYYRSLKFGTLRTDFSTWFLRYLSASGIYILTATTMLSVLALIISKKRMYMFFIPIVFLILGLFISVLYPRIVTPLFYESSPVTDTELRVKIEKLLDRADIEVRDIETINRSKYSSSVNAYMTGVSSGRKIVLFDTLLEKFSHDEIIAVVAHELCHYKEEHVLLGIVMGSLSLFFVLPFLSILSRYFFVKNLRELTRPDGHAALIILISIALFFSIPFQNPISRIMEERADRYALAITENPDAHIQLEIKLSKRNHSNILSHPLNAWFYRTHPSVLRRIAFAEEYAEQRKKDSENKE